MNDNPGVHRIELHQPKKAFSIIPNSAVRDPRITANSFRLLAYLLSHNDGYELTYRQIEKQTGLGRYAINAASKQLAELGWLNVEQTKLSNGQFGAKSWILLTPDDESVAGESVAGQSAPDPFHSGTAHGLKKTIPREDYLKEENYLEKTLTSANAELVSSHMDEFDQFWKVYPGSEDKPRARREFDKAVKRVSLDVLLAGAIRYRDDPNRDPGYTKNPATWLHNDSWNNPLKAAPRQKLTNSQQNIENFRNKMALLENPTKEITDGQATDRSITDFGIQLRSTEGL